MNTGDDGAGRRKPVDSKVCAVTPRAAFPVAAHDPFTGTGCRL
ncbi:hypothetical protein [Streptomyces sp. PTD5-9]